METTEDLAVRLEAAITKRDFSAAQLRGFAAMPMLGLMAGAAIGYGLATSDNQAKLKALIDKMDEVFRLDKEIAEANAERMKDLITLKVKRAVLQETYERFKHLDAVFDMVKDSDGTENTDPFHMGARDMWRAIKCAVEDRP